MLCAAPFSAFTVVTHHVATVPMSILRLSFASEFVRARHVRGDPGYLSSFASRRTTGIVEDSGDGMRQRLHLRESRTAFHHSPFGCGWSRPHGEPDDAPHCSRVLLCTAEREIVRVVVKKLCDFALDSDAEQNCTAEILAMRRSMSFQMANQRC